MKLKTDTVYKLIYPNAPFPYLAKLTAFEVNAENVTLEFMVDNNVVIITPSQIANEEVVIELYEVATKASSSTREMHSSIRVIDSTDFDKKQKEERKMIADSLMNQMANIPPRIIPPE